MSEEENVTRAAGVVSFFTILSRILGLVRDVVLAGLFGTGMVADALIVALRIPNLLRRLFAEGSLTMAFVPVFTEYLTRKSKDDAFEMARATLGLLAFVLAVVTVAGVVFAPWIVRLQAFGFGATGPKYELTVLLTRITFPYLLLVSIVAFFMGVLNSLRHFAAPAASPIFLNVGIIGGAFLISPYLDEPSVGLAAGVILGGIMQVALQIPWIMKSGMKLLPKWHPLHPGIKRISVLMLPTLFGSAAYQMNSFIGTLLASLLEQGAVASLYFADRLVQFPLGVFGIALSTAILPSLSRQASINDYKRLEETMCYGLRLVFFITLPATAGLIMLGEPLIRVILERGAFDIRSTAMTYDALKYYLLGLWAYAGTRIVMAAFYALQDTKTPVKVALVSLVVNLVAAIILMGSLKQGGIALALSVSSTVQFLLLLLLLKGKVPLIHFNEIFKTVIKSVFASILMGLALHVLRTHWLQLSVQDNLWQMSFFLLVLVVSGILIYLGLTWILGCKEYRAIFEMFSPLVKKMSRKEK